MPSFVVGASWGLISYAACHVFHVISWRVARPKRDIPWLALLLLAPTLAWEAVGMPSAALIHFWLAAQYLAVYPAFQASSPTLHLLVRLAKAPAEGIPRDTLIESTRALDRRSDREGSLGTLGLSREDGSLTRAGKALARFFLGYRKALGLGEGAG